MHRKVFVTVKVRGPRYFMKRVATKTNSKEMFDFDEQQQRKLKKRFRKLKVDTFMEKIDTLSHIIHVKSLGK